MRKKVVSFCVSMLLSQFVVAQDAAIFYRQQASIGLRSFVLLSEGGGLSSHGVSKGEQQVVFEKAASDELWAQFPDKFLALFLLSAAARSRMPAGNHHALKDQLVANGQRDESNYRVPHDATPADVEARLAEYLGICRKAGDHSLERE